MRSQATARFRHALVAAAAAVASLAAIATAPAHASTTQESIFQDDRLLLDSGPTVQAQTLGELQRLGVDTIHSLVVWRRYAPSPTSLTKPAGFNGANPASYPPASWDALDDLVREADFGGLQVLLTPTGPLPAWASQCQGTDHTRRICNPSPAEYKAFFTAVAKRYSGSYHDENQGGGVLPEVSRYSVYNEANLSSWLTPQQTGSSKHPKPSSPARYRTLVYAAADGLDAAGAGGDQLLMGETAPMGRTSGSPGKRSVPPLSFYRYVFCIDSHGRAITGTAGCSKNFRRLPIAGVSTHPYARAAAQGPAKHAGANDLPFSQLGNLTRVLDQAAARGRVGRRAPIFLTEYGLQTDPPDELGVKPADAAAFINQADWMAYRNSRIRSVAQFELTDPSDVSTFNTGLRFANGQAKPSYAAYRMPIWVVKAGKKTKVFGQVRPAAPGTAPTVQIQRKTSGGAAWKTVATTAISRSRGYFYKTVAANGKYWRVLWQQSSTRTLASRTARVGA